MSETIEKPRWQSAARLTEYLAVGILQADPHWNGYRLPPGFADVLEDFSRGVWAQADERGAFEATPEEVQKNLKEFVHGHPVCLMWNRYEGDETGYRFTSRYTPQPTQRQFIDLDAIVQNATHAMRVHDAEWDRFNADFDAKHNKG